MLTRANSISEGRNMNSAIAEEKGGTKISESTKCTLTLENLKLRLEGGLAYRSLKLFAPPTSTADKPQKQKHMPILTSAQIGIKRNSMTASLS